MGFLEAQIKFELSAMRLECGNLQILRVLRQIQTRIRQATRKKLKSVTPPVLVVVVRKYQVRCSICAGMLNDLRIIAHPSDSSPHISDMPKCLSQGIL